MARLSALIRWEAGVRLLTLNGSCPESRTYKRTPKLQTSDCGKAWASSRISGATKKDRIGYYVLKAFETTKKTDRTSS